MNKNVLYHWVTESTRSNYLNGNKNTIENRIQKILNKQEPLIKPRVLYRVHTPNSPTIIPGSWFSTSKNKETILREFTNKNTKCCLFKIHVQPGIKVIDVDEILKKSGKKSRFDEAEVIVDNTGVFSHPLKANGFLNISNEGGIQTFETYYRLPKNQLTKENILEIINENEYEFINSENDILTLIQPERRNVNIPFYVYKNTLKNIKNKKTKKGGKRINNKTRKRI